VLLEVGLWERVDKIDKGALLSMDDPNKVTARLIKHTTQRLAYYTGNRYTDIVLSCLRGEFGDADGDVTKNFAYQVTQVLRKELK
jgi:hypothetical protein